MSFRQGQAAKYRAVIVRGAIVIAVMTTILVTPRMIKEHAAAAPVIPSIDPNSVVPQAFRGDKSWSEEGAWHWVTLSYDGTQRFTGTNYDYSVGKPLPVATYVATLVRTLTASDSCADCINVTQETQGPPSILGGPDNPALKYAYAHLDNGPRHVVDSNSTGAKRWTRGSWYLNFSPISRTFFSWTWIPDDGEFKGVGTSAEISTAVLPSLAGLGALNVTQVGADVSRIFPIAGSYRISQGFGCVPLNSGYASPSFCPPNRPSFHDGVDLAAPAGTPIVAAASGKVTFAGVDSSASGNSTIVIDLDGSNAGYETVYMHWEKSYVKKGDHVSAGQPIAAVGSVGYSTGPHLHFSVRIAASNQTIDPIAWLGGSVQLATVSTSAEPAFAGVMQWQELIQQAAAAHNVPAGLLAAIMSVESSGNPNSVSPAGALGLMQLMPNQLARLGVPESKWTDPASNIDAAARYLAETLGSGGSLQNAVARYFGSGCDVLGTCTKDYVSRVLTLYVYFTTWIETGTAPAVSAPIPAVTSAIPTETTTTADTSVSSTGNSSIPATVAPTASSTPTETPTQPVTTPATTPTDTSTTTATPTNPATETTTPVPTTSSTATSTATSKPATTATSTPVTTATATPAASTPNASATSTPTTQPASTPAPTQTAEPTQTGTGPIEPTVTTQPDGSPVSAPVTGSESTEPVQIIIGPKLSDLKPTPTATAPTATP